jgi:AAA ATPase domain
MTTPFNTSVVCPILIGRTAELAALHLLLDQAKSGKGQVVLLSGEAGIGKSRLSGRYPDPLARSSLVLARHSFLGHWRGHLRGRRRLSVQPAQRTLSQTVPQPVQLLRALLSPGGRSSMAPGPAPRRVLPGLLLGTDAGHVWDWRGQPGVDGAADRRHGRREDLSWRAASQPGDRDHLAGTFRPLAGPSCLAPQRNWCVSIPLSQWGKPTDRNDNTVKQCRHKKAGFLPMMPSGKIGARVRRFELSRPGNTWHLTRPSGTA